MPAETEGYPYTPNVSATSPAPTWGRLTVGGGAGGGSASQGSGWGSASVYATGAGAVIGFIGQIMAANQARKAAQYNADVASVNAQSAAQAAQIEAQQHQRNAAIAVQDILVARQAQQWQEEQQRIAQEYQAGQTHAIVSASGLLMRGSPNTMLDFQVQQQEKTILAGRYAADLRERALTDQARQEEYAAQVAQYGAGERLRVGRAQAGLAEYEGSQRAAASTVGALGGLASGVSKTYAAYERSQARKKGVVVPEEYGG